MKKFLAWLLLVATILSLCGCAAETAPTETAQVPETTLTEPLETQVETLAARPKVQDGFLFLKVSAITFSVVGESEDIYLGMIPREEVTWESDDPSVVSVENGVLTAPFGGTVTAVNYDPGDTYMQGAVVTLQDCSSFEISAQIGQYDISDIALGQKVLIKTDATREQELEGTVVFISPTATVTAGMQTTDPTYEVKISVDTKTDRLRLDMSANLSIIIAQHENCLTVPYNAVQTAEDGSRFVEVVGEDESLTVVPVKVVLESNYYTEVSGDLTEGQQVRVVSEGSSMLDMFEAMGMEMGGF